MQDLKQQYWWFQIKGLAYSPFALLAASILVAAAFTSMGSVQTQVTEPAYLNSVEKSIEITQSTYAEDSLTQYIQNKNSDEDLQQTEQIIKELMISGNYSGSQLREATLPKYIENSHNQSSKINRLNTSDLNVSIENLSLKTSSNLNISLNQLTKPTEITTSSVPNIDDPLLQSTPYSRKINDCSFTKLASKRYTGTSNSGTVRGNAVVEPTLPLDPSQSEILVTENVTQYSTVNVEDFGGYFSQVEPSNPSSYNSNYVVGTSSTSGISNGSKVIIHEGFWTSNFGKAINQDCYMPTSHTDTPSIVDRINENTRGSINQGIFTVASDISDTESEIIYERLDSSGLDLIEIETISSPGAWPNYSMSRGLAEEQSLDELIK